MDRLIVHASGAVLIAYEDGTQRRYPTLAAYDAAQENLDRQRAAIGYQQTFGASL